MSGGLKGVARGGVVDDDGDGVGGREEGSGGGGEWERVGVGESGREGEWK